MGAGVPKWSRLGRAAPAQNEFSSGTRRPPIRDAPAAAFKTECIFSADQDDCARLFCEKVALSLQETQLRKVFGSDFELMYGRYKASIHPAHSATRGNM